MIKYILLIGVLQAAMDSSPTDAEMQAAPDKTMDMVHHIRQTADLPVDEAMNVALKVPDVFRSEEIQAVMWEEFEKFVRGEDSFFYLTLQPIAYPSGVIHHWETLQRSKDGMNRAYGALFAKGGPERYKQLTDANIAFATKWAGRKTAPVSFNFPSFLLGDIPYVHEVARKLEPFKDRIIVEISEKGPFGKKCEWKEEMFKVGIEILKSRGLKVSLDDISVVLVTAFGEEDYPHKIEYADALCELVDEFKFDMQDIMAAFGLGKDAPQPNYRELQATYAGTEALIEAVIAGAEFAERMLRNGKTVVLEWSVQDCLGQDNPYARLMQNPDFDGKIFIQGHKTGDYGVDEAGLERLYGAAPAGEAE